MFRNRSYGASYSYNSAGLLIRIDTWFLMAKHGRIYLNLELTRFQQRKLLQMQEKRIKLYRYYTYTVNALATLPTSKGLQPRW